MDGGMGALQVATGRENGGSVGASSRTSRTSREHFKGATFKGKLAWLYRHAKRPMPAERRIDLAFVILSAVVYGVLYFGLGSAFLPGHAAWCTLLLWVAAQIGSIVAYFLFLPNVIGMLVAGILMENLPWDAVSAFPSAWGNQMRAAALATIFLRCGLELDFGTMRRFKGPSTRLALIPGLCEAFFDGGIASVVFDMPITLGFTLGFIMKAVGPGLVVPAMFKLQKTGLGRDQGIPSTVVIAASFDDIVAITGYSIFVSIAIQSGGNTAWQIAEGPLQVVFGICGGIIAGVALGCTQVFDSKVKRLVGTYGSSLLIMFFLGYYNMKAGGALGALAVGLIASNAWEKGVPRFASLGPALEYSPAIERWLNKIWVWIMEPMLFVTIGASINFKTLDGGTIPKALIIIFSGLVLRQCMTFISMCGFGYTWREKLFFALAWTPKATVQAALSAAPLAMIEKAYSPSDPDYSTWIGYGNDILTTGVFTIIICGTLGVLAIHYCSPLLLQPSAEEAASPPGTQKSDQGAMSPAPPGPEMLRTGSAAHMPPRPASGLSTHPAGAHEPGEHDYELIVEYIDAIRHLTAAAQAPHPDKEEIQRLSRMVLHIQQRIETEVGRREPSVREMFRTAHHIASQRTLPIYQQQKPGGAAVTATSATAPGMPSHGSGSFSPRAAAAVATQLHHRGSSDLGDGSSRGGSAHGGSSFGPSRFSRPATPADQA